jgi:hypothetical protein
VKLVGRRDDDVVGDCDICEHGGPKTSTRLKISMAVLSVNGIPCCQSWTINDKDYARTGRRRHVYYRTNRVVAMTSMMFGYLKVVYSPLDSCTGCLLLPLGFLFLRGPRGELQCMNTAFPCEFVLHECVDHAVSC